LVPWSASEGFVDALEVGPRGVKEVIIQEGVGHACTTEMVDEAASWQLAFQLRYDKSTRGPLNYGAC